FRCAPVPLRSYCRSATPPSPNLTHRRSRKNKEPPPTGGDSSLFRVLPRSELHAGTADNGIEVLDSQFLGRTACCTSTRASRARCACTDDFGVEVPPAQVKLGGSRIEVLGHANAPRVHGGVGHTVHRHSARDGGGAVVASSPDTGAPIRATEVLTVESRIA